VSGVITINPYAPLLYPETARLFSVLAYPADFELQEIACKALTHIFAIIVDREIHLPNILAEHESHLQPPANLSKTIKSLNTVLAARFSAARMMHEIINDWSDDDKILKKTWSYLAEQTDKDKHITHKSQPASYNRDVWLPSIPSLHIAITFVRADQHRWVEHVHNTKFRLPLQYGNDPKIKNSTIIYLNDMLPYIFFDWALYPLAQGAAKNYYSLIPRVIPEKIRQEDMVKIYVVPPEMNERA